MINATKICEDLKLPVTDIEKMLNSYSSSVFKIRLQNKTDCILKIPFSMEKLNREVTALQLLKEYLPVPEVMEIWKESEQNRGAILMTCLSGNTLSIENLDYRICAQLGEMLAMLHEIPMPSYDLGSKQQDGNLSLSWHSALRSHFEEWLGIGKGSVPDEIQEKSRLMFEHNYLKLPEPVSPTLIHYDYHPGNLLMQDSQITGILDFEGARGAVPALDFTKVQTELWEVRPETKGWFMDGYQSVRSSKGLIEQLPFYNFYNAYGSLAWSIKRKELGSDFYLENLKRLQVILNHYSFPM